MNDKLIDTRWGRLGILVMLITFASLRQVTYGDQAVPSGSTSAEIERSAPLIYIDQELYFSTPEGTDTVVSPGAYRLDHGVKSHLKLTPEGNQSGMDIQALPTSHGESLSAPLALLVLAEEDAVHLVLLLPDGKGIDAVGSTSRIRSRAPSAESGSSWIDHALGTVHRKDTDPRYAAIPPACQPRTSSKTCYDYN